MEAEYFKVYSALAGFLAIMPRPRILRGRPDSIDTLAASGIHRVVSLLQHTEAELLGLQDESKEVLAQGMQFDSFPVADFGVPSSLTAFAEFTREMSAQLTQGANILIHCRGGVGRSGLVAAGVMLQSGVDPGQVFSRISARRGVRVPETDAQQQWLMSNYEYMVAP